MKTIYKYLSGISVFLIGVIIYFLFLPNLKEDIVIYLPTGSDYKELKVLMGGSIKNEITFDIVSKLKKYKVKAGKYSLKKSWGNNQIINYLRVKNEEINVIFNNQETLNELAKRISEQIEADSADIINKILDKEFLKKNNFTQENVIGIFIPNTYKFYWNTSADKFVTKMLEENNKFWNNNRKLKAEKLGLTPKEVMVLASVVHKETSMNDEKKRVAGLYVNRLKQDMKLQSDPTVIYAVRKICGFNKEIKRVLFKHLEVESPYNTYRNLGLPPSPICIPDVSSIDAVLNYEKHEFIFMCASVEKLGYHEFSKNFKTHEYNRQKYIRWLDINNIK